MNRPFLAALLAILLALACRIHVTIWLAGHPVARPPVAGLILAALIAAVLFAVGAIVRTALKPGFRGSSPRLRAAGGTP